MSAEEGYLKILGVADAFLTPPELPRYRCRCHKEVQALKIKEVLLHSEGATLVPEDEAYPRIRVDQDFVQRYRLDAGGYLVYDGGRLSFGPAEAFEESYTRL